MKCKAQDNCKGCVALLDGNTHENSVLGGSFGCRLEHKIEAKHRHSFGWVRHRPAKDVACRKPTTAKALSKAQRELVREAVKKELP